MSKGIKSVSAGLAVGVQRASGTTRFLPGLELDLRLTPFGQQRTPVFALYARGDLALGNGDPALTILGGARVLTGDRLLGLNSLEFQGNST